MRHAHKRITHNHEEIENRRYMIMTPLGLSVKSFSETIFRHLDKDASCEMIAGLLMSSLGLGFKLGLGLGCKS